MVSAVWLVVVQVKYNIVPINRVSCEADITKTKDWQMSSTWSQAVILKMLSSCPDAIKSRHQAFNPIGQLVCKRQSRVTSKTIYPRIQTCLREAIIWKFWGNKRHGKDPTDKPQRQKALAFAIPAMILQREVELNEWEFLQFHLFCRTWAELNAI